MEIKKTNKQTIYFYTHNLRIVCGMSNRFSCTSQACKTLHVALRLLHWKRKTRIETLWL